MTLEEASVLISAALLPEVLEHSWRLAKLPGSTRAQRPVCFMLTLTVLLSWQGMHIIFTRLGLMAFMATFVAVFFVHPYEGLKPPYISPDNAEACKAVTDLEDYAEALVLEEESTVEEPPIRQLP